MAKESAGMRRRRHLCMAAAGAVFVLALWWLLPSGSAPARAESSSATVAEASKTGSPTSSKSRRRPAIYWGAWIGEGLTGTAAPYDMGAVTAFQQMVRKRLSIVEWS